MDERRAAVVAAVEMELRRVFRYSVPVIDEEWALDASAVADVAIMEMERHGDS